MTFKKAKEELNQNKKFQHIISSELYYDYLIGDWEVLNNLKGA